MLEPMLQIWAPVYTYREGGSDVLSLIHSVSPHNLLQSVFSRDVESGFLPFVPSQVPKHYLSIHAVGPCRPDVETRPSKSNKIKLMIWSHTN